MIRVLLAEDQAMVRGALSALLSLESDIEVLGSAPDGEAAWRELHDDEGDDHDPEQRRDHQQQASQDVGAQVAAPGSRVELG